MFDNLTDRLTSVLQSIKGSGRLTETNIKDTIRQVRLALIEADVSLPIVKEFIANINDKVIGIKIEKSLTPGQALTKIIHSELIELLGKETYSFNLNRPSPVIIMLVGLQGSGKTTTAAKLANRFIKRDKKRVLLTSVDIHRPAAIDQLKKLSSDIQADFYSDSNIQDPNEIIRSAKSFSEKVQSEILIIDTAGRTQLDEKMMSEIVEIDRVAEPQETFFVVDSMAGQDAINPAKTFSEKLSLTGVILSKTDGDARGGVALSVRKTTGKPLCFIGTGEKVDDIEIFHPDRMASRILGMGDVLSLVEEIQLKTNNEQSEKLAKKLKKGRRFDLYDLKDQLQQMNKIGSMGELLKKLPMANKINPSAINDQLNEKQIKHQIAIIDSMTPSERRFPKTINGSRKKRIARGSGLEVQDVNKLMKQYIQMEKMMKKMSGGKMKKMMRGISGMNFPPGMH